MDHFCLLPIALAVKAKFDRVSYREVDKEKLERKKQLL